MFRRPRTQGAPGRDTTRAQLPVQGILIPAGCNAAWSGHAAGVVKSALGAACSSEVLTQRSQMVDQLLRKRSQTSQFGCVPPLRRGVVLLKAFRARDAESPNIRAVSGSLTAK